MKIQPGFTVFASSPADDISLDAAKKYITDNQLTSEHVRIFKNNSTINVITKSDAEIIV